MKKTINVVTSVALAGALLSSCASIVHGSHQAVAINTNAPNTKVTIDGMQKTAPATFDLKGKGDGYLVTASAPGYEDGSTKIDSKFRWGSSFFGNILFLLPGLAVDFITGAAYELDKTADINLQKKGMSASAVTR